MGDLPSSRLVPILVVSNVIALQLGALTPQPPSRLNTAVSLLLLLIAVTGAGVAGSRRRRTWMRDAVRDVTTGQTIGWLVGLGLVAVWHGGLNSPRWLLVFFPVFVVVTAGSTACLALIGHWLARPAGAQAKQIPPAS